jgi:PKHD-type hydroxylase
MKIQFPVRTLDQFDVFAFFEKCFSHEECEKITELFVDMQTGLVDQNKEIEKIRKSKVKFVDPSEQTNFVFQKFYDYAIPCNDVRWKFQLSGFYEGIQLTEYDEHGSHYDWHTDNGNNALSIRKLSLILLLNEPEEYDGGEIEFLGVSEKKKYPKGTLIVFPSYVGHKVHPVTKGNRKTAVAWISGEPYK